MSEWWVAVCVAVAFGAAWGVYARRREALAERDAPAHGGPAHGARLPERALRAAFDGRTRYVGRNLEFVLLRAGPFSSRGDFDVGVQVFTWLRPGYRVDVWFRGGACTQVKTQDLDFEA